MNFTTGETTIVRKPVQLTDKRVSRIPLDAIKPNPYQPRRTFAEGHLEELAASIKQYGLLQPISVRLLNSGCYELIAGERRYRACRLLGLGAIDAIVYTAREHDSAMLALIENLQRQDLHFLEEAEAFLKLLNEHNISQDELAKRLGKSQSAIANKLRLLRLPAVVRRSIITYNLTERHARALLRIKDYENLVPIMKQVYEQDLNVRQTEEMVERLLDKHCGEEAAPGKARARGYVRDARLFLNSIQSVVTQMKDAGLNPSIEKTNDERGITLTVFIPRVQPAVRAT